MGQGAPIHATMVGKALVLEPHHGVFQGGRDGGQGLPFTLPPTEVDAHLLHHHAVAIKQPGRRRRMLLLDLRQVGRWVTATQHRSGSDRDPDAPPHGITSQSALGTSPNCSGWYIASTRVVGNLKRPAWFNRSVYSRVNKPFGTQA